MMKPSDLFHDVQEFRNERILRKIKKRIEKECRYSTYSFNATNQPDMLLQMLSAYTAYLRPYNLSILAEKKKESVGYLILLPKQFACILDTLGYSKTRGFEKSMLMKYFAGEMKYRELRKYMIYYSNMNDIEISLAAMDQFDATDFICMDENKINSSGSNFSFMVGHEQEINVSEYEVTPNTGVILPYIKGNGKISVITEGCDIQAFYSMMEDNCLRLKWFPAILNYN